MPKLRIKRFFYRNDHVHAEIREVGGQFHGLYRTWHFNGQLSEELRYRHGRLHGTSRHWDENGRLLGSFIMNHGTGTQRYWHQNGRLRLEINSFNGKFFGRTRTWLWDGTLVKEIYYISNVDVTRAAYLKAARKHPDWPQHEGQTAGRVVRESRALERRQHELFIESLLEKSHAEARQWLSAAKNPNLRSLANFARARWRFDLWKRYTLPVQRPLLLSPFIRAGGENYLPTGCWSNYRKHRQNGKQCENSARTYATSETAHCCRIRI